jgi:hypothetical protein
MSNDKYLHAQFVMMSYQKHILIDINTIASNVAQEFLNKYINDKLPDTLTIKPIVRL